MGLRGKEVEMGLRDKDSRDRQLERRRERLLSRMQVSVQLRILKRARDLVIQDAVLGSAAYTEEITDGQRFEEVTGGLFAA